MFQQVEGSPVDPYADCQNAIKVMRQAESSCPDFFALIRASGKSLADVAEICKASSQDVLDAFGIEARAEFKASLAEFNTPAFRLWLQAKLGGM